MTKRVATTLALALVLVGCSASYTPVPPLTGSGLPEGTCFTYYANGPLVADPIYGTAIINRNVIAGAPPGVSNPPPIPLAWRPGFNARRVGSEVEVLDPQGHVVAITGRNYRIAGGYVSPNSYGSWPGIMTHVFWACASVTPQS